jgi:hypothetical protein
MLIAEQEACLQVGFTASKKYFSELSIKVILSGLNSTSHLWPRH